MSESAVRRDLGFSSLSAEKTRKSIRCRCHTKAALVSVIYSLSYLNTLSVGPPEV